MKQIVFLLFCVLLFSFSILKSQDLDYAHKVINTLTSEKFHGRGYVKSGDLKAANFLKSEFKRAGLQKINSDFFQPFSFPVNTFPKKIDIVIGNKKLIPGVDFILNPNSSGANATYELRELDIKKIFSADTFNRNSKTCFIIRQDSLDESAKSNLFQSLSHGTIYSSAIILLESKKLTWSVAKYKYRIPVITILSKKVPPNAKTIRISVSEKFIPQHQTQNVLGFFKGTSATDSFLVFTAHYDHLGMMGDRTYFPGANDNASGVSMLLNLIKYYSDTTHRPKYNLLFIAFAGEEAGLIGSKYFTEHPLIPLEKIRFLINMDLMGTGDEGMMVVNATEFKTEFALLKNINDEKKYVTKLGERGKAQNSDHYFFTEKGVPSFFFYTLGGIAAYHDVYDKAETLPLTDYADVFKLIVDFAAAL